MTAKNKGNGGEEFDSKPVAPFFFQSEGPQSYAGGATSSTGMHLWERPIELKDSQGILHSITKSRGRILPSGNPFNFLPTSASGELVHKDNINVFKKFWQDIDFVKIEINRLIFFNLTRPLDVFVEKDGDEFIARAVDLDRYGLGDSPIEAIQKLKYEIEDLYSDLIEEDCLTAEWLSVKKFLAGLIDNG